MTNEQQLIQQEGNTIAYYLAKGFSPEMAECYASGVRRPIAVVAQDDFTLPITFDNSEVRRLDVKSFVFLESSFEPFRELKISDGCVSMHTEVCAGILIPMLTVA